MHPSLGVFKELPRRGCGEKGRNGWTENTNSLPREQGQPLSLGQGPLPVSTKGSALWGFTKAVRPFLWPQPSLCKHLPVHSFVLQCFSALNCHWVDTEVAKTQLSPLRVGSQPSKEGWDLRATRVRRHTEKGSHPPWAEVAPCW